MIDNKKEQERAELHRTIWGIANDLLMGFYCELDGPAEITMDPNELKYAAWVKREDIVLQPDDFSLTNEMMMRFKTGQER